MNKKYWVGVVVFALLLFVVILGNKEGEERKVQLPVPNEKEYINEFNKNLKETAKITMR